ncbi:FbpB family small basic protein [Salisediminibacterium halotolerans]|uniref:Fur-regulated basic protein B n=1 Tax=Salisediminibacterium halotolerans TaxID=517425 RepID=A0A1H9UG20_9BACI|nr:FbpB family small basic protein [Salisediminibacterium haloalkalitolerans]SES08385.1 Fur-regulated basic protein B [Salisediminibacterium haloalkalitolerans]
MGRRVQKSFDELVKENKAEILKDDQAMSKIEERIDQKYEKELAENS